jgi:hypothetical protein
MLNDLKTLLGFAESDTDQDEKLNLLLSMATARLKMLLGGIDPPESMRHIIVEAAVIRFNRIGSEGLSSHSVEGESLSFIDGEFDGFTGEIQAFLDTQEESSRGRLRFL